MSENNGKGNFWRVAEGVRGALARAGAAKSEDGGALRKLGASPFAKTGFPVLGFLETVYEHVAGHAERRLGAKPGGDL